VRRRTELALKLSSAVRGGLSETEPRHPALGVSRRQLGFDAVWTLCVCLLLLGRLQLFLLPRYQSVNRVPGLVWFGFALSSAVYRILGSRASPYLAVGLSQTPFHSQIRPLTSLLHLPPIRFFTFQSVCFTVAIAPVVAVSSKSFCNT